MPEHTRPREKLRKKGAAALTDEDLVARMKAKSAASLTEILGELSIAIGRLRRLLNE